MEIFDVCWNNYDNDYSCVIGRLFHENKWYFKYHDNINEAIKKGFRPFPDMPKLNKVYESEQLFNVFRMRYMVYDENQILNIMKNNLGNLATDRIVITHVENEKSKVR